MPRPVLTVRGMTVTAYSLSALAAVAAVLCLLMLMQVPAAGKHRACAPPSLVYTRDMETTPVLNRWYRSTIDPQMQGKVTEITPQGMVTVALGIGNGRTDRCTLAEFADSWQEN